MILPKVWNLLGNWQLRAFCSVTISKIENDNFRDFPCFFCFNRRGLKINTIFIDVNVVNQTVKKEMLIAQLII